MTTSVFFQWLRLDDSRTTSLILSSMILLIFQISDFNGFINLNDGFSGNSSL